jgi:hypothetical protein
VNDVFNWPTNDLSVLVWLPVTERFKPGAGRAHAPYFLHTKPLDRATLLQTSYQAVLNPDSVQPNASAF